MASLVSLDLHCHILPGIDDGAKTIEDSEVLARRLVEIGISHVVCTSHIQADLYPNTRATLLPLVASTQAHFDAVGIPLKLVAGSEVRMDQESCVPESWLTIGDLGKHVLVEMPPGMPLIGSMDALLFDLQARGITPIIAHPERQAPLQKDPEILARWVDRGILAQGTLCALAGAASERTVMTLEGFLQRGLIAFMGSDAHNVDRRIRDLDQAVIRLEEVVGAENARLIRFQNPQALLTGEPIIRPAPYTPPVAPGLFQRFLTSFKRA
ncbi:MAG: tyrosine protein phosphatase [Cyanobacteria bacterium RYN_339]|nr:tyrosine protein phosphatase [Cyanobacteria bacterium RYN_339]